MAAIGTIIKSTVAAFVSLYNTHFFKMLIGLERLTKYYTD